MALRLFRFISTLSLLLWLGMLITISFVVAPSLFDNESGVIASRAMAGTIVGPLLSRVNVAGWALIPLAAIAQGVAWILGDRRRFKAFIVSIVLLVLAWIASLATELALTPRIQEVRAELTAQYGSYDEAPEDAPGRQTFGALHGVSASIALFNLLCGLGALFIGTELIGFPHRSKS